MAAQALELSCASRRWHRRGSDGVTCTGPTRAIIRARHSPAPCCATLPCALDDRLSNTHCRKSDSRLLLVGLRLSALLVVLGIATE